MSTDIQRTDSIMENAPISLCHICLRSDRRLLQLDAVLRSYYTHICDFDIQLSSVQCCGECTKRLRNSYEFKDRCVTAAKKLLNWKIHKECERTSIDQLYTELPSNLQLSLSNKNNFKVHFYQAANVKSPLPTPINNSKHPHIFTINVPPDDDQSKPVFLNTRRKIKKELDFVAFDDSEHLIDDDLPTHDVFQTETKTEIEIDANDYDRDSPDIKPKKIKVEKSKKDDESLASVKEKMKKTKKNFVIDKKSKTKTFTTPRVDVEFLRKIVREKFDRSKVVKDDKGNAIDKDIVLGCFDKLSFRKLYSIKVHCGGRGPFSAKAIKILSELHNQYAVYDKMNYTIHYMHDDAQMQLEFARRREYSEYVQSSHRCENCIRGFRSENLLKEHIKSAHDESRELICNICKMRFKNNKRLHTHMVDHRLLYKCKLCPYVTPAKNIITTHCNSHAGIKYTCKDCGEEFKCQSVMYAHYNRTHKTSHPCELCAFSSVSKMGLAYHKIRKHKNEKFVEGPENKRCESCNVTFISDDVYQKHMTESHEQKKGYITRPRNIPRTCRLCDSVGYGRLWLPNHMKSAHPGTPIVSGREASHLCATCGKGFYNVTAYNEHMNIHTGARPYTCPHCPKAFHTLFNLHMHKKRHLPPTHECNHCGKKFLTSSNLCNHIKTHIGDRRFKCEICDKGFLHNAALRGHVERVHYNIRKKRNRPKAAHARDILN